MPLATSRKPPPALTSKPQAPPSSRPGSAVAKRRWNAPPSDLFPVAATPRTTSKRTERPATATDKHLPGVLTTRQDPREQFRAAIATASAAASASAAPRRGSTSSRKIEESPSPRAKTTRKDQQNVTASPPTGRRLSQPTRLRRASEGHQHVATADADGAVEQVGGAPTAAVSLRADPKRQQLLAREAELTAMQTERRRDSLHSAQVLKSLRRQDVEADDVSPLIEIIYWSPFVEVRRDAAAAIASLSRNTANLELLDEVGTLGVILTMLSSPVDREDSDISHDCAQALAALVRLSSVKTKLLQAPGGIDCVFSLLHTTTDQKLRLTGFEVVARLVTTDEWREAVAKREGFAFMLTCCSGSDSSLGTRGAVAGDTRTRTLAASVLHQLAASCDNRVLFYYSGHFTTLSGLLRDPFLDKDAIFRRELLSFIHLLLSEAENARRFASLGLLPCVLSQTPTHCGDSTCPDQGIHFAAWISFVISPPYALTLCFLLASFRGYSNYPCNAWDILRYGSQRRQPRTRDPIEERERLKEPKQLAATEDDVPPSAHDSPRGLSQASERDYQHYIELLARGVVKCLFGILAGDDFGMKVDALGALAQLTLDAPSRLTLCKPALLSALGQFAFHPLASTRLHVAQIIANFAERPENVLKLMDAGLLPVLVRYVSPVDRGRAIGHSSDKRLSETLLVEATRALAAVSELHVARSRLVESGVLGALMRLVRAPSNRHEMQSYAQSAVRNLRHDAAALRIQAIYRGWHVRTTFAGPKRRQNFRKISMLVEAATASTKQR
ncbi:hypothetical protein PF001_g963 [Phytophthora fragariae]|uniref:Vacuolar protein 8 n=1 Tax=Phytophthora fragariae TaxID=53985 RepID=A0A6A4EY53_9STRA|nr:hypothetical protein PF001_g963 [Phytophthora fragariae]